MTFYIMLTVMVMLAALLAGWIGLTERVRKLREGRPVSKWLRWFDNLMGYGPT
ncbi:hypothetical protein [Kushneria aurantia]|uniref:Uncharacterized protein n=1 Tax=Kushneria aurantia TaxID=504092 RepID=A0ABV6G405_9GAMM|nr:hypothetical protein [Kushneria aurantia]